MPTFKAVVMKHHKKADGTFNIKIRVTQNRVKRYIATPFFVTQKDLTRSCELKNQHYIDLCDDIIRGWREKLEPWGMSIMTASVEKVVEIVTAIDTPVVLMSDVMKEYFNVTQPKKTTIESYMCTFRNLKKYFNTEEIDLCQLNKSNIQKWILSLTPSTAECFYRKLNSIYNFAIKTRNDEENGIKVIPYNPMKYIVCPKVEKVEKRAITVDQLRMIINYECSGNTLMVKKLFLFSFYMVGMNVADIVEMDAHSFDGEYYEYCREKTKKRRDDKALIRIKIQPEAREYFDDVIKYIRGQKRSSLVCNIARHIKTIANDLGFSFVYYSARHTWATLAVNDCNIDKYTVHLSLNHVDTKTAITDIYIKKDFKIVDDANRKVIDYVLNKN